MFHRKFFLAGLAIVTALVTATAADWQTDYDKALTTAKAQKKQVLLDFTGSDWCGPCIELKKRAFSRPEFKTYADKNLVLVEVDFPKRKVQSEELKSQNEKLAQKYGLDEKGFPTIVLLDSEGKIVREFSGYDGENATDLIEWIEGKKKLR